MSERSFLWLAQVFFGVSLLLTVQRWRTTEKASAWHRANHWTMLAGFLSQTMFLLLRGMRIDRCPLTNRFEALAFIAWAVVLFYLLIGPSYRVSFLGAFTAPLVLTIHLAGLLAVTDVTMPHAQPSPTRWIESHAAIAILAYGAFALSFVLGGMYVVQERQLKRRRFWPAFVEMPAIEQLDIINARLMVLGFALLTVGMLGGAISHRVTGHTPPGKVLWAVAVWIAYGGVLAARQLWSLRGCRAAVASMMSFAFLLVTFWIVSLLAEFFGRAS